MVFNITGTPNPAWKTLEIDPTFRSAIEGEGYGYSRIGKPDKSIEILKKLNE